LLLTPIYIALSHDWSYLGFAIRWVLGAPLVMPVSGKLNPVMWSLVVEAQFYIVLPLLFVCLKRVPTTACLWIISLPFLILPTAWRWFNYTRGVSFTLYPEINVHFPTLLDYFYFGVLLGGLESMGMLRKSWAKLGDYGFALLAISLLASSWLSLHPIIAGPLQEETLGWLVKIASGLLLCYIADPQHPRSRLLAQPWLRWCGIISYEWYLFHQPVINWARSIFGPSAGNLVKYSLIQGGSLIVGLIIAAAVYRYFSLPILKYGRSQNSALKEKPKASGA